MNFHDIVGELARRMKALRSDVDYLLRLEQPSDLRLTGYMSPVDHFTALDTSVWTWAGAPFGTPGNVSAGHNGTYLKMHGFSSSEQRAFLYKSGQPSLVACGVALNSVTQNFAAGIRIDDGTDNNYAQSVLRVAQSAPIRWSVRSSYRKNGGTVTTVNTEPFDVPVPLILKFEPGGTLWSFWFARVRISTPLGYGTLWPSDSVVSLDFTPARYGLLLEQGDFGNSEAHALFDFFADSL